MKKMGKAKIMLSICFAASLIQASHTQSQESGAAKLLPQEPRQHLSINLSELCTVSVIMCALPWFVLHIC